jgi:predicted AlkP superfamily phosphohydrolase/phosphomutase
LRAKVASALPEPVALELTSRLELRGVDWSRTRAFAHPAENQGYIRLNLRGRERDGIVDPADADALMDELAAGIASFHELDGSPAVKSVEKVRDLFGTGDRAHQLPDLIVKWVDAPATRLEGLRSERFGTVRRHGVGSGRSGNHTEGNAWALVVPGSSRHATPSRRPRLEDIAATAAALSGLRTDELVGEPLLAR